MVEVKQTKTCECLLITRLGVSTRRFLITFGIDRSANPDLVPQRYAKAGLRKGTGMAPTAEHDIGGLDDEDIEDTRPEYPKAKTGRSGVQYPAGLKRQRGNATNTARSV